MGHLALLTLPVSLLFHQVPQTVTTKLMLTGAMASGLYWCLVCVWGPTRDQLNVSFCCFKLGNGHEQESRDV